MRIFALPNRQITAHSSRDVVMDFLPRILGADQTRVHIAHVRAGGMIGEHPAPVRQVFVILSGRGDVAADDGARRSLEPGQAVMWEPGEEHQTWATTDMVAVIVETTGTVDLDDAFIDVPV